jgi:hypothetical protein
MIRRIKLMADYGGCVLWHADDQEFGGIDPAELPISAELRHDLHKWAEWYDGTLDQNDPPDSGFPTAGDDEAFEAEGRRLWRELRKELGADVTVVYFSKTERRLIEEP